MKIDNYTQPFWVGNTMYDESVMLVAKTDDKGNVISAPKAKLLFEAGKSSRLHGIFMKTTALK